MLSSKKTKKIEKKLNKTIHPASPRQPTDVPTAVSTRTAANPSLVAHTPQVGLFRNYSSLTAHTPQVQQLQSEPKVKGSSPRQLSDVPTAVSTRTAVEHPSLVAHTPQVTRFGSESAVKKASPKQMTDVPTAVSSRTARNPTSLVASTPQIQRAPYEHHVKSSSPKQLSDVPTAVSTRTANAHSTRTLPDDATQRFKSDPDIKTAPMQVYTAPVVQKSGRNVSPKTATLGTFTAMHSSTASTPPQTNSSDFGLIPSGRTGATQLSKISSNEATQHTQASLYSNYGKTTRSPYVPVRYVTSSYVPDNTIASARTQNSRTNSAARTTQHSVSNSARTTQQSITAEVRSDRYTDDTVLEVTSGCNTAQRNISINSASPKTDTNMLRSSFLNRDLFSMKTDDFEKLKKDLLSRKLSGGNIDITDLEMIRKLELNYSDMSGNNLIETSEILTELIGERTVTEDVAKQALAILVKIGYISQEEMLHLEELQKFSEEQHTSLNDLADIVYKMKKMEIWQE